MFECKAGKLCFSAFRDKIIKPSSQKLRDEGISIRGTTLIDLTGVRPTLSYLLGGETPVINLQSFQLPTALWKAYMRPIYSLHHRMYKISIITDNYKPFMHKLSIWFCGLSTNI